MILKIKKDPLSIVISLIYNLNLLEENREYNINELKFITGLDNHWITIKKYLKIFKLIQNYCPQIELKGSKLRIINSKIYKRLGEKEKFILYLFNNHAISPDNAIEIPKEFDLSIISESINYLFKKTEENKFYLTESGLELYKYFKKDISDLIYNHKEIDEIFGERKKVSFFIKDDEPALSIGGTEPIESLTPIEIVDELKSPEEVYDTIFLSPIRNDDLTERKSEEYLNQYI